MINISIIDIYELFCYKIQYNTQKYYENTILTKIKAVFFIIIIRCAMLYVKKAIAENIAMHGAEECEINTKSSYKTHAVEMDHWTRCCILT